MAIEETLSLQDDFSGPIGSAADRLAALEAAWAAADAAAEAASEMAWLTKYDEVDAAAAGVAESTAAIATASDEAGESAEGAAEAIGEVASAAEEVGEVAPEAFEAITQGAEEAAEESESLYDKVRQGIKDFNQAAKVVKFFGKAADAVIDVAVAFGKGVSEAHLFRSATEAALNQLTDGRGEEALASLSAQAHGLGITTESAVDQFTALRKAGASNADAQGLIALRADLEAVGVSSADAGKAVDKALSDIKGGKDASKAIADVAKQFGAVGDGANAAAKRSLTWAGMLQNIQGLGGRVFGVIAEQAGPSLDKVGAKITAVLDAFEDSGTAGKVGQILADGLDAVPGIIDAIMHGFDSFMAIAGPGIDAVAESFGELGAALGGTDEGMSSAAAIGSVLGVVIGGVAQGIATSVSVIAGFVSALQTMGDAASGAYDAVSSALGSIGDIDMVGMATNLVQGFINGLLGMIGSVASAAADVAGAATDAIAGALQLGSPSKLTEQYGNWTGEGFDIGLEDSMPTEIAAPEMATAANDVGGAVADAAASSGGGWSIGEVTIQIVGSANMSPMELRANVRAGLIQAMRAAA